MPPRRRPRMEQVVGQTSPQPWTGGIPSGEDVAASVAFFESLGGPRPIYYEDIIAYLQFEVSTAGAFFGRLPKKQGIADAATRKAFSDLKRVLREQVLVILREEDLIATGALARSIHVREFTPTGRSRLRAIQLWYENPIGDYVQTGTGPASASGSGGGDMLARLRRWARSRGIGLTTKRERKATRSLARRARTASKKAATLRKTKKGEEYVRGDYKRSSKSIQKEIDRRASKTKNAIAADRISMIRRDPPGETQNTRQGRIAAAQEASETLRSQASHLSRAASFDPIYAIKKSIQRRGTSVVRPKPSGEPGGFPFMAATYNDPQVRVSVNRLRDSMLSDALIFGYGLVERSKTLARRGTQVEVGRGNF